MKDRVVIRFLAEVNQQSAHALISVFEKLIKQRTKNVLLLISSPGGSVPHGMSIYNFLKKAPITIETCNFGSVDSIATVVYCAGAKRTCVPNARFVIHGINFNIASPSSFEEKKLNEIISGLSLDRENISKIISESCKKSQSEIEQIMLEGKTYGPQAAMDLGLVDEIDEVPLNVGEKIIGIG